MEQWKDIAGYEGIYQVSNEGRVRSLDRMITYSNGRVQICRGKILSCGSTKTGYQYLSLYKDSKPKNQYVHRLVASAFLQNPDNKPCINHIDGDKTNNHASNLEWCTHSENSKHAYHTGLMTNEIQIRESVKAHNKPVLMKKDGVIIERFASASEAARQNGFDNSYISACCRGKKEFAYGYQWEYAS